MRVSVIKGSVVVVLFVLVVAVAVLATRDAEATTTGPTKRLDLRALAPGLGMTVPVGDLEMGVSVPEGEGHTGGSFRVRISEVGFDSGALPREGSLESAWVEDVNEDEEPDVVFVVRGGGSGSYASVVVVESAEGSFVVRRLPPVTSTVGYMGHDEVLVEGGQIVRSFPTYVNQAALRIDRQWDAKRGDGEGPMKSKPDTNVSPSGKTMTLGFDRASASWRELP